MKSGNLNFLEPSGPLQACNGTDLPLSFYFDVLKSIIVMCNAPYSWYQGQLYYICRHWHTQEFFSEGIQQIQLRTEDRENRDLGVVAPYQGFWRQL